MFPHQARRIKRELECYDYVISIEDKSVEFEYNKKYIKFILNSNYPFRPPLMLINEIPVTYNPIMFPKRLYDEYKDTHACPCCESIVCAHNWIPTYGVLDVLREYNHFIQTLKNYQRIRFFKKINLPDEIIKEIVSYIM